MPVTRESLNALNDFIVGGNAAPKKHEAVEDQLLIVVLKQHKYYKYLFIELYSALKTKDGKIKNPLTPMPPLDFAWKTEDHHELKFFTGIQKFQNHLNTKRSEEDLIALRAIIKNPLGYRFYYHDNELSDNITASSIIPIEVGALPDTLQLTVNRREVFYELSGTVKVDEVVYPLGELSIKFNYFLLIADRLYLVENLQALAVFRLVVCHPDVALLILHGAEPLVERGYPHSRPLTQAIRQGILEEVMRPRVRADNVEPWLGRAHRSLNPGLPRVHFLPVRAESSIPLFHFLKRVFVPRLFLVPRFLATRRVFRLLHG